MTTAAHTTSAVALWGQPPEALVLSSDEVHVWQASLDQAPSRVQDFLHILAPDEQARASRFYFAKDREHYIVARGVLRAILGRYLDRAPECLSFCYGAHGKPALRGQSHEDAIRFNVSHSQGIALYAFARSRQVGVDVEHIRLDLAVAEIAARFFSPREAAMLLVLPPDVQRQAFFRCWTRKEAYIKALGEGLSLPLDQFDLSSVHGEPATSSAAERNPSEASRWSVREISPAPGYAAALAVEGHDWRLVCWQCPNAKQQSI
jgi:4'-phosphopantetheinyl transferase